MAKKTVGEIKQRTQVTEDGQKRVTEDTQRPLILEVPAEFLGAGTGPLAQVGYEAARTIGFPNYASVSVRLWGALPVSPDQFGVAQNWLIAAIDRKLHEVVKPIADARKNRG